MAPSFLELKVNSCKDVKAFNFFKKLCISATVSIVNEHPNNKKKAIERYQKQKTQVDQEGDGFAEWNHQMSFDLSEISSLSFDNLFLDFNLKCEGIVYGNNTVGQVRVPIKELLEDGKRSVKFVCYQVMSTDGKHNGVIEFSYKVIDHDDQKAEENRYQSTPSIYPALESIESINVQPVATPEVHDITRQPETSRISPHSIYPSLESIRVLPEKPQVHFHPPVEVSYYSPPPPPFLYPHLPTSYGTAQYDYNAGLYPFVGPFQPYHVDTLRRYLR